MSDTEEEIDTSLFQDPEGYYPPSPPPRQESYTLQTRQTLTLHLVGHSPLEAHHLWNGARVVARLFEDDPSLVRDRTVLELGAGAGLPSLVAAAMGCRRAVVTDFPDVDLVANMWRNVDGLGEVLGEEVKGRVGVKGFVWGGNVRPLLEELQDGTTVEQEEEEEEEENEVEKKGGFDVLILADLLFRHSEHGRLVKTIREALGRRKESRAYVVFTSYRPWLRHKDLAFFDGCREEGFVVEQILERKLDAPLFENDPGDVEVQKTVTGHVVRWKEADCY